jgi:hypothetical protein
MNRRRRIDAERRHRRGVHHFETIIAAASETSGSPFAANRAPIMLQNRFRAVRSRRAAAALAFA